MSTPALPTVAHDPGDDAAWARLAAERHGAGDMAGAADALGRAFTLSPRTARALTLGKLALGLGQPAEAVAWLERAAGLDPASVAVQLALTVAVLDAGDPERGMALTGTLLRSGQLEGEEARQAASLRARCVEAAKARHAAALAEAPDDTARIVRCADFLMQLGEEAEAIALLRRAAREHPEDGLVLAWLLRLARDANDWDEHDSLVARTVAAAERDLEAGRAPALNLNVAFSLPVPPSFLRRMAEAVGRSLARPTTPHPPPTRSRPLRVGYLSGAFRNDATSHLMQRVFGLHDRRRISPVAFSFGPDDGSDYRRRIAADADSFVELRFLSDEEAAAAIRAQGIEILVDVDGYFGAPRPGIAARRPAPVQVRFLDFPGTSGAPFFDYYVSDRIVTPPGFDAHFSERLIRLPHCYQVNDDQQPFAPEPATRATHGLPEEAVVFCCFCSPFKIEPAVFGAWMRVVERVPGSVLWLMRYSALGEANLRREAAARGVDPARLVFAPFLDKPGHLTRHRLADVALDTPYWNGHTTSSDALWAGVPVVTLPGGTFAARVSASLLHAVGLPELVAGSLAAYEELAVGLGRDPARLADLKRRLAANRATHPLFDTARWVRGFEAALEAAWDRHRRGLPPDAITIADPA